MKIALIGYGKMGREIDRISNDVVARIGPGELTEAAVAGADVCIEFTRPDTAWENIQKVTSYGKPLVVGTTGWFDHLPEVDGSAGVVYGENFLQGVHRFIELAEQAKGRLPDFAVAGVEMHHSQKVDAPSGTGRALEERLGCSFSSVRCGEIPGTHQVIFSAGGEIMTLTHQALSREPFARGALAAAEWILGKTGIYHFAEMQEALV